MPGSIWDRALLFDFIELYKSHPCLWLMDKEVMFYNKAEKKRAYMELVNLIKDELPNSDINFVKTKIKNIRNSFRREYNKVKKSQNVPGGIIHVPRLWYYELLLFTKNQNRPAPETMNRLVDESGTRSNKMQKQHIFHA